MKKIEIAKKELNEKKNIGIIRHVDSVNRISLPSEYCKYLDIKVGTKLEMILYDDNTIVIKKYNSDSK